MKPSRLFTILLTGLATAAHATPAPEMVAIVGGEVHDGDGHVYANVTVLVHDGVIQAIGSDITVPADAERIDARGMVITPGLMDAETQIGIREIEGVVATNDQTVSKEGGLTAALDISTAINSHSTLIPITRVEGVTHALVTPLPGWDVLVGQAAVIQLGEQAPTVIASRVALVATLGSDAAQYRGGSHAAALQRLRSAFVAVDSRSNADHLVSGEDYGALDLEALADARRRHIPLMIDADRESDIRAAMALASAVEMRLVILNGREAWRVATELARQQVSVVMNPLDNIPLSFDYLGARLDNAKLLHDAGVRIAFTDEESENARRIRFLAGNAVANGLPWEAALTAITSAPADIFGLGKQLGRLKPGYQADLVIWDGDPLEVTTLPERVMIDGRWQPMTSRQTQLRDRYLKGGETSTSH